MMSYNVVSCPLFLIVDNKMRCPYAVFCDSNLILHGCNVFQIRWSPFYRFRLCYLKRGQHL